MWYTVNMKNDNDFNDYVGYVAMVNDKDEPLRGCVTCIMPIIDIILVCLGIFFIISSCS